MRILKKCLLSLLAAALLSSGMPVIATGQPVIAASGSTLEVINPVYSNQNIQGIWGTDASNIWAVGSNGLTLHNTGSGWTAVGNPVSTAETALNGIWGSSSTDVFAVGVTGTVLRYDGSDWTAMTSGITTNLHSVWGSSSSDVYAVGRGGVILQYNGSMWSPMTSGTTSDLNGIWGTDSSNVWAVGDSGTVLKYNGTAWAAVDLGTTNNINSIWGTSASDIFVCGDYGTIMHYDGSTWGLMDSGHYDSGDSLYSLWGTASDNVYAVGNYGKVLRYNGTGVAWSPVTGTGMSSSAWTKSIWGSSADDIYIGGSTNIRHYDGTTWSRSWGNITTENMNRIHGLGVNNLYISGSSDGDIFTCAGSAWNYIPTGIDQTLNDVWARSANDVWAGYTIYGDAADTVAHYDGTLWTPVNRGTGTTYPVQDIFGLPSGEVYVLSGDIVSKYDGSAWSNWDLDRSHPMSIWGTATDNLYVAGYEALDHYNGESWTQITLPVDRDLNWIWGTSDSDIWAVGILGAIYHYDGTEWTYTASPVATKLLSVHGTGPNDVFAVGENGVIIHYNGTEWSHIPSGTTEHLTGVWCDGNGVAWIAGENRTLMKYSYEMPSGPEPVTIDLRATGVSGDIINVTDYSVPYEQLTEDGHTINSQTAMGALVYYCQQNSIDILVQDGEYGLYVYKVGTNDTDNNTWTYAINEATPMTGAADYTLSGGEAVHWTNYTLGLYSLHLALDTTSISAGDTITATVTYVNGEGTTVPADTASVYVATTVDTYGNPVTPGTLAGTTNGSGELAFTWDTSGTFYPYAEWNSKDTVYQYPVVSFACAGVAKTVDLRVSGTAGDIINVTGYEIPAGDVTEDGHTMNGQTAMGALVYYCQQNSIEVTVQDGEYGLYVYQIGTNAADENSWTYAVDEVIPATGAANFIFTEGQAIHWSNYTLGLYSLQFALDAAQYEKEETITATVSFIDGDGTAVPENEASVYVASSVDAYGNPVTPGTLVGTTDASGQLGFTWDTAGTFYPYAESDGRNTVYQYPAVSFLCTPPQGTLEKSHPLTSTNHYHGIDGSAADDIWLAGEGGAITRFDGTDWIDMTIPDTYNKFEVVTAFAADDVWIAGQEWVYHWDGTDLSPVKTDFYRIQSMWGVSSTDLWVGDVGYLYHWNGESWTIHETPESGQYVLALWGTSSTNLYFGDSYGKIYHWDGSSWTNPYSYSLERRINDIWGTGADNIYAATQDGGIIIHFDGTSWTESTSPTGSNVDNFLGFGPNDIFAICSMDMLHFDGTSWTNVGRTGRFLNEIWGTSSSNIYGVGNRGEISHYDGTEWTQLEKIITTDSFNGIYAVSPNDIYAVGDYWAFANYDGSEWSKYYGFVTSGTYGIMHDVWGTGSGDLYGVGVDGIVLHSDGTAWSQIDYPNGWDLYGIQGFSPNDIWVVGEYAATFHYDGTSWTDVENYLSSGTELFTVWGLYPDDVFAAGENGHIIHWDGTGWTAMNSGTTSDINQIWGTAPDDVYAVGEAGALLHYDGTAWSTIDLGIIGNINGIHGTATNNIFLVGAGGIIMYYNGEAWTPVTNTIDTHNYTSVCTDGNGVTWIIGEGGIILKYTYDVLAKEDITVDLRVSGAAGDIINVTDYTVAGEMLTEDGLLINPHTAMGVLVHYCQQHSIEILVQEGEYGLYAYKIGTNDTDNNTWTYAIDETIPMIGGANYYLLGGEAVHWSNYTLGLYNLHLDIDKTEIESGETITATVTYTNGDGAVVPAESASIYTSDAFAVWGGEVPFGEGEMVFTGNTSAAGELAFVWSPMGTYYIYADWNDKTTFNQYPTLSFTCGLAADDPVETVERLHPGIYSDAQIGVWGSGPNDVFVSGYDNETSKGSISHYNGTDWTETFPGTSGNMMDVWGAAEDDVFAVSETGDIYHYDGSDWTNMSAGSTDFLMRLWGSSGTDVFAVGINQGWDTGIIRHYDGSTWSTMTSGLTCEINDVWGTASDNVFAAAADGTILHYNGTAWSDMSAGRTDSLYGLWGTAADNMYAVGYNNFGSGVILNYNGTAWSEVTTIDGVVLVQIWGSGASDIYVVGTDTGWADPIMYHYNGTDWTAITLDSTGYLYGIWGSGASDIYAVGNEQILHYDGSTWNRSAALLTHAGINAMWVSGTGEFFAVGQDGAILHDNGTERTAMDSGVTGMLEDVWGTASNDVYAVGRSGTVINYNGTEWAGMTSNTYGNLYGVTGFASDDITAVGHSGAIMHWDGTDWTAMTSGTNETLRDVWGTATDNMYAVGYQGTILSWNGTDWTAMTSGSTVSLYGIWGTSVSNIYAVGSSGSILHYNGTEWSAVTHGFNYDFRAIHGNGPDDIYAVGQNGKVVRYNGTSWEEITSGTELNLAGVYTPEADYALFCGQYGTVLEYTYTEPASITIDLHITSSIYDMVDETGIEIPAGYVSEDGHLMHTHTAMGALVYYTQTEARHLNVTVQNGDYGLYVYQIGTIEADENCWTYAVDATVPLTGAADYTLSGGEAVHWSNYTLNLYSLALEIDKTQIFTDSTVVTATVTNTDGDGVSVPCEGAELFVSSSVDEYGYPVMPGTAVGTTDVTGMGTFTWDTEGTFYTYAEWNDKTTVYQSPVVSFTASDAFMEVISPSGAEYWGYSFTGIWGSSASDIFAVGSGDYEVFHYDGTEWSGMTYNLTSDLNAVFGNGPDDVYAVENDGIIVHYDGTEWTAMTSGVEDNLIDVWCDGTGAYAVGDNGVILHYNGSAWSTMTSGTTEHLRGIWGSAANDIYAVGDTGTVLHYDGYAWSTVDTGTGARLFDVWGTSSSDVYLTGNYGTIMHYDGAEWTAMDSGYYDSGTSFNLIWGSGPNDIYTMDFSTILHYNGSSWNDISGTLNIPPRTGNAMWGTASDNIYLVGRANRIVHYDGTDWKLQSGNIVNSDVKDVWGSSPDNVYLAGSGTDVLIHYDGTEYTYIYSEELREATFRDVWGSGPDDIYAWAYTSSSGKGMYHYDGTAWTEVITGIDSIDNYEADDLWGTGPDDVYAVSSGGVAHFDGETWTEIQTWGNAHAIWGAGGELFLGGSAYQLFHYTGTEWEIIQALEHAYTMQSVWGTSPNSVYAVGSSSRIIHWNGENWTNMTNPVTGQDLTLYGVHGTSDNDVFAVGKNGVVLHYNGTEWTQIDEGLDSDDDFYAVWCDGKGKAWIVGDKRSGGYVATYNYEVPAGPSVTIDLRATGLNDEPINVTDFEIPGIELEEDGFTMNSQTVLGAMVYYCQQNGIDPMLAQGEDGLWLIAIGEITPDDAGNWYVSVNGADGLQYGIEKEAVYTGDTVHFYNYTLELYVLNLEVNKQQVDHGDTISFTVTTVDGDGNTIPVNAADVYVSDTAEDDKPVKPGTLLGQTGINGELTVPYDEYGTWYPWAEWNGKNSTAAPDADLLVFLCTPPQGTMEKLNPACPVTKFNDVWSSGPDDVWVFGDDGAVTHYDGTRWSDMSVADMGSYDFDTAWGYGPDDIWASGDTNIYHWDGTSWNLMKDDIYRIRAMWGTSSTDMWFGDRETMYYYDGTTFTQVNMPSIDYVYGFWGFASDDIYCGDNDKYIFHWDGTSWTEVFKAVDEVYDMWGTSPTDVWAALDSGDIAHWDGTSWTETTLSPASDANGIWGTATDNVYVVCDSGRIHHFNGTAWTQMDTTSFSASANIEDLWGSGPNDIYAAGYSGYIYHFDGTSWTLLELNLTTDDFKEFCEVSWNDLYAFGENGLIAHYDGSDWALVDSGTTTDLWDGWAAAADDIFVVGDSGLILHCDGSDWATMTSPTTEHLYAVWGFASDDVWAVTDAGETIHYNGTEWSLVENPVVCLYLDIWGPYTNDIFAIGSSGTIIHYNGDNWTEMESGITDCIMSVWGLASDDVYASSASGILLHYDGTDWTQVDSASKNDIYDIHGSAPNNIFTSGYAGTITYYNGEVWTPVLHSDNLNYFSVYTDGSGTTWFCGQGGLLAKYTYDALEKPAITIDLRVTGASGNIIDVTDYSLVDIELTEDGYIMDSQTAMGAVVYYCQQNSIDVTIQENEYGLYIYQAGDNAADENTWTYNINENMPAAGAAEYILHTGEAVHWANYTLNVYNLNLALDTTSIASGDTVTTTVTYIDGDVVTAPVQDARVYVSNTADEFGNPVMPGILVGMTDTNDECAFPWGLEGTWYPYAIWDIKGKNTVLQYPAVSFDCTGTGEPAITVDLKVTGEAGDVFDVTGVQVPAGTITEDGCSMNAQSAVGALVHYCQWNGFEIDVRSSEHGLYVYQIGYDPADENSWTYAVNEAPVYAAGDQAAVADGDAIHWSNSSLKFYSLYFEYANPCVVPDGSVYGFIRYFDGEGNMSDGDNATIYYSTELDEFGYPVMPGTEFANTGDGNNFQYRWQSDELGVFYMYAERNGQTTAYQQPVPFFRVEEPIDGTWEWITPEISDGTVYAIDAIGPNNVYVGVGFDLYHYNGESWSMIEECNFDSNIRAIWHSSENDIWVGGYDDYYIGHYDGTEWTMLENPAHDNIQSIWGTASDNIYFAGEGYLYHYDGTTWTPIVDHAGDYLYRFYDVYGSSADDIYAVGWDGLTYYYDGTSWTDISGNISSEHIYSIWGTGTDNYYAAAECYVYHGSGATWTQEVTPDVISVYGNYEDIWGLAADDIYAVGDDGAIIHYNGTEWTAMDSGLDRTIEAVHGLAANNVYACSYHGALLRYDGSSWSSAVRNLCIYNYDIYGLWGSGPNDVYFAPYHQDLVHWDGTEWTTTEVNNDTIIWDVYGFGPDNVYLGCQNSKLYYWGGENWTELYTGSPNRDIYEMWGTGPDNLYLACKSATLRHYDGTTFTTITGHTCTGDIKSIWGSSDDDLFIGDDDGKISHWNGTSWTDLSTGYERTIIGIWGSGPDDVYIVGERNGYVYHWNGTVMEDMADVFTSYMGPINVSFDGVYGTSAEEVVFASRSQLYFWDGTELHLEFGTAGGEELYMDGANSLWVCDAGEVARFYYGEQATPDPITVDLRVTGTADDILDVTGYEVPYLTVTEDSYEMNSHTAMGALVYYCQQNTIDITIQDGEYGLYVYQVGTNAADENSWTYTVDEVTPLVSGDQKPLVGGEAVHWANYNLGLYQMTLTLDKETIEAGDSITATVTYVDGDGTTVPADGAQILVANGVDAYGSPLTPGTGVGTADASGQLAFTWDVPGTLYPYAEWNGKDTVYQYPAASFVCTPEVFGRLYISPAAQNVTPGKSFTIGIRVNSDNMTRGAECGLQFDPSLVQVDSVTESTYYEDWADANGASTFWQPATIDNTEGTVTGAAVAVIGATGNGPTGDGEIMQINMTALTDVEGISPLTLTDTVLGDVNGVSMYHATTNGAVTVSPTSLVAETSLTEALNADEIAVVRVNIDRIKDPDSGITTPLTGGLGSFTASIDLPDGGIEIIDVLGVAPYANIDYNPSTRTFTAENLTAGIQADNTTVAEIVVRLTGNCSATHHMEVEFLSINGAGGIETNILSEMVTSMVFRRGDANNDGNLAIGDALRIAQFLAELRQPEEINEVNAASVLHGDENGDWIAIGDALAVAQELAELRDEYYVLD